MKNSINLSTDLNKKSDSLNVEIVNIFCEMNIELYKENFEKLPLLDFSNFGINDIPNNFFTTYVSIFTQSVNDSSFQEKLAEQMCKMCNANDIFINGFYSTDFSDYLECFFNNKETPISYFISSIYLMHMAIYFSKIHEKFFHLLNRYINSGIQIKYNYFLDFVNVNGEFISQITNSVCSPMFPEVIYQFIRSTCFDLCYVDVRKLVQFLNETIFSANIFYSKECYFSIHSLNLLVTLDTENKYLNCFIEDNDPVKLLYMLSKHDTLINQAVLIYLTTITCLSVDVSEYIYKENILYQLIPVLTSIYNFVQESSDLSLFFGIVKNIYLSIPEYLRMKFCYNLSMTNELFPLLKLAFKASTVTIYSAIEIICLISTELDARDMLMFLHNASFDQIFKQYTDHDNKRNLFLLLQVIFRLYFIDDNLLNSIGNEFYTRENLNVILMSDNVLTYIDDMIEQEASEVEMNFVRELEQIRNQLEVI